MSPHPEIIQIQQKFSIPVACFVFAVIGLALGLTVARDGKLAGFVVGIAVIFALLHRDVPGRGADAGALRAIEAARGLARPVPARRTARDGGPNVMLGAVRRRRARLARALLRTAAADQPPHWRAAAAGPMVRGATAASRAGASTGAQAPASRERRRRRPRAPAALPGPGSSIGTSAGSTCGSSALSFLALLGLFYISTFIDASDKLFKGSATGTMVHAAAGLQDAAVRLFRDPDCRAAERARHVRMLSRTSELTVMKACGISLYRVAVPVVLLSLAAGAPCCSRSTRRSSPAPTARAGAIDDTIRGRPPKTFNPLNRRWMIGRDGSIYHYGYFDPRHERADVADRLSPAAPGDWRLASQTYAATAVYRGTWTGHEADGRRSSPAGRTAAVAARSRSSR